MSEKITLSDAKAEALEKSGLWRRAARRWLEVMDASTAEKERERIVARRQHCIGMASSVPSDHRRY